MNIWAQHGHVVKLIKEVPGLMKGKQYTVDFTMVRDFSTQVYLIGMEKPINSVKFEDVTVMSAEDEKKHPDWRKYNE